MKVKDNNELLYKPFNIANHADNFTCYCEVIIHPDGEIEYAIPSHERKLINVYAKLMHMTEDEVIEICKQYDVDYIDWLMKETGCIFVWYNKLYNGTNLTAAQKNSLSALLRTNCISDRYLQDIQSYEPYKSAFDRHKAMIAKLTAK